jgi:hypothetical protein
MAMFSLPWRKGGEVRTGSGRSRAPRCIRFSPESSNPSRNDDILWVYASTVRLQSILLALYRLSVLSAAWPCRCLTKKNTSLGSYTCAPSFLTGQGSEYLIRLVRAQIIVGVPASRPQPRNQPHPHPQGSAQGCKATLSRPSFHGVSFLAAFCL